jgi:tRNA G18 (ribose-2'-O)-methylase SpoU
MPAGDRKLSTAELPRVPPGERMVRPVVPVRVVLDDVRSRMNVGSIFRTADAFAVEGISLCGITPCPPHREIEKTALGATASVPWCHAPSALAEVERLRAEGYRVMAVEQTMRAVPFDALSFPPHRPLALVLGNELHGVSDAVVEACDACLVVPQFGSKHSLNVAVCAGVVLWWFAGRHRPRP